MIELILIAAILIYTAYRLPVPSEPEREQPECHVTRARRQSLEARSGFRVYRMRVHAGHWEALTDRGWIKEQDLLTRAIFEEECQ